MTDLAPLFIEPQCRRHKYYEVLRAAFVDQIPLREIAQRFGFSHGTVRNLCSAFRQNPDLSAFFIPDAPPPKPETQTPLLTEFRNTRDTRILELRNHDGLSVTEIYHILKSEGIQYWINSAQSWREEASPTNASTAHGYRDGHQVPCRRPSQVGSLTRVIYHRLRRHFSLCC